VGFEVELSCEGAPRDLGHDLGLACRERVRARVGQRSIAERVRDAAGVPEHRVAAWLRDVRRYFPHQHEWLEGLARAVELPVPAVARSMLAVLDAERDAMLVAAEQGGAVKIWRRAPATALPRRVEPEGRFVCLELAAAILTTPFIGVNDQGLAIAVAGDAATARGRNAHGALFARDCLERFDALDSALDWCAGRPAAPGAVLLLGDAAGDFAGISLDANARPVRHATDGVLVMGVDLAAAGALEEELRKLRADADAFEARVREALVAPGTDTLVSVEAEARRLSRAGEVISLG
jgi:hypothetical protein